MPTEEHNSDRAPQGVPQGVLALARMHPLRILATTLGAALLVLGLLFAYASSPAWAAIITVNSLADDADGTDGKCTLREAITAANTDTASGTATGECAAGSGDDGIDIGLTGTVNLTGALPNLSTNITIAGPGADEFTVRRDSGGDYSIFTVTSGSVISVSGITISGGNVSSGIGGGGILINGGNLTITESTISGNSADQGGGIFNQGGTLMITSSTISDNSAIIGGGVFSNTDLSGTQKTTITNTTISGNTALQRGGGVINFDGLSVIEHSTITNNTAPSGFGSGVASVGSASTLTEVLSTIISANPGTDVDVGQPNNSFDSKGYNLIGDGNATGAFNQTGDTTGVTDPKLGALSDNGGPTQTHALLTGSPAIDAGPPTDGDPIACPPPDTDQRGVSRPQGSACDIGSFELEETENQAPTVAVTPGGSCGASDMRGTINLALSDPDDPPQSLTLAATSSNRSVLPNGNISFGGGTDASRTMTVSSLTGSGSSNVTIRVSDGEMEGTVLVRVISGSASNNTLTGSTNPDMIFARKGSDTVSAQGANDLMCGGNGNDKLTGGLGADRFGGGSGTDTATDFDEGQGDTKAGIP